jgi:ubiquinol-cytochrome c reductase iron-sulfur subunit
VTRPAGPATVSRRIAAGFALCALGSAGFAVVYALGGQAQAEGALLGLAFAGLAYGLVAWAAHLMPPGPFVEERESMEPSLAERVAFQAELERDIAAIGRRGFLGRMLALALGTLAVALAFPIRSLSARPGRSLYHTAWSAGTRLVTKDGTPVRPEDLQVGSVLTVYPEGHVDAAGDSAVLLIRVDPGKLVVPQGRETWSPLGLIAYSKLCTHAGCPVGLYQERSAELFCPCHQSVFYVLDGARPIAGPASRPLPQLPLELSDDGFLRAQRDFAEPVGPAFWRRT